MLDNTVIDQLKSEPQKILVQQANTLSDMILTLPLIETLKNEFPLATIDVITSKESEPLCQDHPHISNTYTMIWKFNSYPKQYRSLLKKIKSENYLIYIGCWENKWCNLLPVLAKIPNRIANTKSSIQKWFITHQIQQDWDKLSKHQVNLNLNLISPLIKPPKPILNIPINKTIQSNQKALINSYFTDPKPLICCLNSSNNRSQLPHSSLTAFLKELDQSNSYNIIIWKPSSKPKNSENTDSELIKGDNIITIDTESPKIPLLDQIALINESDFIIGPTSPLTHIAGFLKKPCLIYSSQKNDSPSRWGNLSPYQQIIRLDQDKEELTKDQLTKHWQNLVNRVTKQVELTPKDIYQYHWYHTTRILYSITEKEPKETLTKITELQKLGLKIHPINTKDITKHTLLHIVREKNINVVQGPIANPLKQFLTFRCNLHCPVIPNFVPTQISKKTTLESLLECVK